MKVKHLVGQVSQAILKPSTEICKNQLIFEYGSCSTFNTSVLAACLFMPPARVLSLAVGDPLSDG